MPSKGNYVCTKCHVELKCSKTGVLVEELTDQGEPYKVWSCDLFKCPKCGAEIAGRFGDSPIAEHYQVDYMRWASKATLHFGAKDGAGLCC